MLVVGIIHLNDQFIKLMHIAVCEYFYQSVCAQDMLLGNINLKLIVLI